MRLNFGSYCLQAIAFSKTCFCKTAKPSIAFFQATHSFSPNNCVLILIHYSHHLLRFCHVLSTNLPLLQTLLTLFSSSHWSQIYTSGSQYNIQVLIFMCIYDLNYVVLWNYSFLCSLFCSFNLIANSLKTGSMFPACWITTSNSLPTHTQPYLEQTIDTSCWYN